MQASGGGSDWCNFDKGEADTGRNKETMAATDDYATTRPET